MSQEDFEDLPTVPFFDKHGNFIPNNTELPVLYILKKKIKEESTQDLSSNSIPWYPQIQWETTATSTEDETPNCILSKTTKVPPARLDTNNRNPALRGLPMPCQEQADVLRLVGTELQDHQPTVRGLEELRLA